MSCWKSIICFCKSKESATIDHALHVTKKETNNNSSKESLISFPIRSPSLTSVDKNPNIPRRKSTLQSNTSTNSTQLCKLNSKELNEAVLNGVDVLLKRKKSNLLTYQDVDNHHTTLETSTEYVFKNAMSFEDIMIKAEISDPPTVSSSTLSGYIEK